MTKHAPDEAGESGIGVKEPVGEAQWQADDIARDVQQVVGIAVTSRLYDIPV